jgi:hypothetical protein
MQIEQVKPNKPNFGLILGLFCATLIVIFVLALLFLDFEGGHLTFRHHSRHPTSQLLLPASPAHLALDSRDA